MSDPTKTCVEYHVLVLGTRHRWHCNRCLMEFIPVRPHTKKRVTRKKVPA